MKLTLIACEMADGFYLHRWKPFSFGRNGFLCLRRNPFLFPPRRKCASLARSLHLHRVTERAVEAPSHMAKRITLNERRATERTLLAPSDTAQRRTSVSDANPIQTKDDSLSGDEGAFFGLNTDWGNGTAVPIVPPNKGAFFGLHTDWGNDSNYLTTVTKPDEGALFALHADWGDGTKVHSVKLSPKGAFFALNTDWGKSR